MFLFKQRFATVLFSIVTLIAVQGLFFSCRDNIKEIDEIMQKQTIFPSEQGETVEILYTDSGLVRIRITAPVMNHFTNNVPEPYTEMPKGVFIEFFTDSGKVKATLKANYAVRYERTKKTEAKNNVIVTNIGGDILNTEKLNWDESTRKIYTDAYVKITTKKDVLKGTGMEANEDFTEYEIRNPVGTHVAPEEEKPEKK